MQKLVSLAQGIFDSLLILCFRQADFPFGESVWILSMLIISTFLTTYPIFINMKPCLKITLIFFSIIVWILSTC